MLAFAIASQFDFSDREKSDLVNAAFVADIPEEAAMISRSLVLNVALMILWALLFYRAAIFEGSSRRGITWACLSVALSLLAWQGLGWGLAGILLAQAGLFAGITIVRVARNKS